MEQADTTCRPILSFQMGGLAVNREAITDFLMLAVVENEEKVVVGKACENMGLLTWCLE